MHIPWQITEWLWKGSSPFATEPLNDRPTVARLPVMGGGSQTVHGASRQQEADHSLMLQSCNEQLLSVPQRVQLWSWEGLHSNKFCPVLTYNCPKGRWPFIFLMAILSLVFHEASGQVFCCFPGESMRLVVIIFLELIPWISRLLVEGILSWRIPLIR